MIDENEAFLDIANKIHTDDANEMLDQQIEQIRRWAEFRHRRGDRVDLKTATEAFIGQAPPYVPMVVCAVTALWRLCEMEAEREEHDQQR